MSGLPKRFTRFMKEYPAVADAYEKLGDAVHASGPLDDKTRALIKLAISTGARMEGAVHAHTKKALKAGISKEEIRQVAVLAIPTIGFPNGMAALSWIDDILDEAESKSGTKDV